MGRPTGRPPLGRAKRNRSVKVSFDDREFDIIDIKSGRSGMSRAEYVREGALNAEVIGRLSDEEKGLLHELKKFGPNLNQLMHHANTNGYQPVAARAEECLDSIASILLTLKNRMKR